jgi:hypothetical protein
MKIADVMEYLKHWKQRQVASGDLPLKFNRFPFPKSLSPAELLTKRRNLAGNPLLVMEPEDELNPEPAEDCLSRTQGRDSQPNVSSRPPSRNDISADHDIWDMEIAVVSVSEGNLPITRLTMTIVERQVGLGFAVAQWLMPFAGAGRMPAS